MTFLSRLTRCPQPYDADLGADTAALFGDLPSELRDLINGTAGCSPYLRTGIEREVAWLTEALDGRPEDAQAALMSAIREMPSADLQSGLRRGKRRVALLTALADLGGVWPLEQVTRALTEFAELAVDRALRTMVAAEIKRGKLPAPDTEGDETGGMVAIAMGKMGAYELNYSSDIDLIMVFDQDRYPPDDVHDARAALVRATRRMTALLSEITGDGYVFRTDLRLRPDASVTPVCLSMGAAEDYYESVGRTWERAAHIKARACAGDIAAGEKYLQRLTPFVWRKHLDFAAIQDAHDMRLRIRAHKGLHGGIVLENNNMKLGPGGIREIEFFTQTRQIIAGGRDADLRVRGTVEGLTRLTAKGWVPPEVSDTLTNAYRAHREVEHRLQMVADAQTHDLPGDAAGFDRLAAFMGRDTAELRAELHDRLAEVHELTEGFFAPQATAPAPEVSKEVRAVVDGWHSYPALRSPRAMEIFERLKPELLGRLAQAAKPDEALEQFDSFLSRLPTGVQVFSLFEANPQLIDLIVDIAATAPALAQYLGRNAQVFDAVIGGSFFDPWPGTDALRSDLASQLEAAGDYERQLDTARRWHKEWHFRIGVHHLRGVVDATQAGQHYASLAEAVLSALWPYVVVEFARKHGDMPGNGAVVLGMGSLGAEQLSATSDLDVIVIYDAAGVETSEGRRPLPARLYYARLTQAFVTALTAQTAEGMLYEVDMRLRPSGRQGPVATSYQAFETYQREEAWTWEHLALTRARCVAGAAIVGTAVEAFRVTLLGLTRAADKVLADVSDMRARLAEAKPAENDWEAKRGPGRIQDIDLLAQAAALVSGSSAQNTPDQLAAGVAMGWLPSDVVETLCATHAMLWKVQAAARLLTGHALNFADVGAGGRAFMLRQTGATSVEVLSQQITECAVTAAGLIDTALAQKPVVK